MLLVFYSNNSFRTEKGDSSERDWWPQSLVFRSSPQTGHSPLQSCLQMGLIGISNIAYSRMSG